jgi:hypothetical protein
MVWSETKPRLRRDARNVLLYMSTLAEARGAQEVSEQNIQSSKFGWVLAKAEPLLRRP